MEDLSLHILDVIENGIRAGANRICVKFRERGNIGVLKISDNGKGMDRDQLERSLSPFYTTKDGKSFGLGLSLLAQAGEATGGSLRIRSKPGRGTRVIVVFCLIHPDMKPLGEIEETIEMLSAAHPDIRFGYRYTKR